MSKKHKRHKPRELAENQKQIPTPVISKPIAVTLASLRSVIGWPSLLVLVTLLGAFAISAAWPAGQSAAKSATSETAPNEFRSYDDEDVDPKTWRSIDLVAEGPDGSKCWITLIRPLWWIEENEVVPEGTVFLDMPEMGIFEDADVLKVDPCPDIRDGPGQVVIGKFKHENGRCIEMYFEGQSKPLGVTKQHPIWSVTHDQYVSAGDFKVGDEAYTKSGPVKLLRVQDKIGLHTVYNLEVHKDHRYFVGESAILVHNASILKLISKAGKATAKAGKTAARGAGDVVPAHRAARFNRTGYRNYRIEENIGTVENPNWKTFYHGYVRPGETVEGIRARHAGNVGPDGLARFNKATDRIIVDRDPIRYGEARLIEHRRINQDSTNVGRVVNSGTRRGNNQNGIQSAKLAEYEAWEKSLNGR